VAPLLVQSYWIGTFYHTGELIERGLMARNSSKKPAAKRSSTGTSVRFESVKLESLFQVLDAVAWLDAPTASEIAQFAGIDPRTAGKLLKNALHLGLMSPMASGFVLLVPYPYKGSQDQKEAAVREALVRYPLLVSLRQFLRLGEKLDASVRKAATLVGIAPFDPDALAPLLRWAQTLGALQADLIAEDLVDAAASGKEQRHRADKASRVAFLSHSSADKPFIRQLAADLSANGIGVWLDEQRIHVGDSIPEKVAQGLADSDFFLIAVSERSVGSEWVKKELNGALVNEVERRNVHVLPLKLDSSKMPAAISDKKYADFSKSYKAGLEELLAALKAKIDG
jgi:hypothetical protein